MHNAPEGSSKHCLLAKPCIKALHFAKSLRRRHQQITLLLSHYYTLLYGSDNGYNIETECLLYALSHYYLTIILLLSYYYTLYSNYYSTYYTLLHVCTRLYAIIFPIISLLSYNYTTIIHYYFTIILPIIPLLYAIICLSPYYTLLS